MVILGLGSNQGDREQHLRNAVTHLRKIITGLQCSKVYESPALLPQNAPDGWNISFLNMAVKGETSLAPLALLGQIQAVEQKLGRVIRGHWGPREIDIDILAFENQIINKPNLIIPHTDLLKRDFALIPLADLAPEWVHPVARQSARALAGRIRSDLNCTGIEII